MLKNVIRSLALRRISAFGLVLLAGSLASCVSLPTHRRKMREQKTQLTDFYTQSLVQQDERCELKMRLTLDELTRKGQELPSWLK